MAGENWMKSDKLSRYQQAKHQLIVNKRAIQASNNLPLILNQRLHIERLKE
tara:strand:- start:320 stop:472 length:153 start_codon:yes stop_codon:yes gene_type:complete